MCTVRRIQYHYGNQIKISDMDKTFDTHGEMRNACQVWSEVRKTDLLGHLGAEEKRVLKCVSGFHNNF